MPDYDPYARRNAHIVERDLVSKGEYTWVADICARVDVAKSVVRDPDDFRAVLAGMGVAVRESASRRGNWVYSLAETPSRQVTGSRLGASYTRRKVTGWLRSPTRHTPTALTARNVRQVAEGAIEARNLGKLVRLSEAVSVVSRGGFCSLAAMDSAAARMRDMPGRDASATRIERTRAFCAERGILPERSAMAARGRARPGAGAAADSHRHSQRAYGGHQPRTTHHQRRDEKGGR